MQQIANIYYKAGMGDSTVALKPQRPSETKRKEREGNKERRGRRSGSRRPHGSSTRPSLDPQPNRHPGGGQRETARGPGPAGISLSVPGSGPRALGMGEGSSAERERQKSLTQPRASPAQLEWSPQGEEGGQEARSPGPCRPRRGRRGQPESVEGDMSGPVLYFDDAL